MTDDINLNEPESEQKCILRVDWSGKLRPRAQLSPTFTISGPKSSSIPSVRMILDERLEQELWRNEPELSQESETSWRCTQFLNIRPKEEVIGDATFQLKVEVKFVKYEGDQTIPIVFQTTIQLKVFENSGREIVIDASDGALINTHNMDFGDANRVVIKGSGDALINLNHGISDDGSKKSEEASPVSKFPLKRVEKTSLYSGTYRTRNLTLTAHFKNRVMNYYLFAEHETILGRSNALSLSPGLVYQFQDDPIDRETAAGFLSAFISRNHVKFQWSENGLEIQDCRSNMGTEVTTSQSSKPVVLDKEQPSVLISWQELEKESSLQIAKIAKLIFSGFPTVRSQNAEPILRQYRLLRGQWDDDLWYFGGRHNIDVIKIKRCKDMLVRSNEKKILGALKRESEKTRFKECSDRWKKEEDWKHDPLADRDEYFLLLRTLVIGNNKRTSPICIEPKYNVASNHALIFYCGDRFGLINRESVAISWTSPDGHEGKLFQNSQPLLLEPGMSFTIGKVLFDVKE